MKKGLARWAVPALMFVFLVVPIAAAAAQNSGPTLYLPVVSKAPPQPAVKQVGPSGGTFTSVAIDPVNYVNPSILYVGTFGQGVQKSLDGGLTWQSANNGLGNPKIQSLTIRPDGWLFAGTYGNGVYRSADSGANWQPVNNFGDAILSGLIVYDIEIAPAQPQTVFLSGRVPGGCYTADCDLTGYIYKSTDGGGSWSQVWDSHKFFTNGDYSYDIEVDPINAQIVYFTAHRNGVYKSENGGNTWVAMQAALPDKAARKLLIITDTPQVVYNSTYESAGVYRTWNGGNTWETVNSGLPSPLYGFALSRDTQNPNDLYLGTGDRGVYKTGTSSINWLQWGLGSNFIWAFGQVPGSSTAVYAATGGNGLQYSPDGSANWQPRSQNIFNTNITGLINFNGTLYAGVNGGGVYRSADQGTSWQMVNSGLDNVNVQNLLVIENGLYAVTTTNLFVSYDGANWAVARSMPVTAPSVVPETGAILPFAERNVLPTEEQALLQTQPVDNAQLSVPTIMGVSRPITSAARNFQGLWTGTAGGGIYREGQYCDYSGRTFYSLHVSHADSTLYASLTGQSSGTYVIKWVPDVNNSCGKWDTEGIPNTVLVYSFASTSSRTFAASSAGVYYKNSNASNWQQAAGISGVVYAVAADSNPANANLLYAAADSGAYFSTDGGLNWQIVPRPELQNKAFLSVQVDAGNPNIVYFGSREGSTYRWDKTLP